MPCIQSSSIDKHRQHDANTQCAFITLNVTDQWKCSSYSSFATHDIWLFLEVTLCDLSNTLLEVTDNLTFLEYISLCCCYKGSKLNSPQGFLTAITKMYKVIFFCLTTGTTIMTVEFRFDNDRSYRQNRNS